MIEDLGEGTDSPDNLLLGNDPTVAKAALLEIAGTLGLMHARSIGGKSRFDSIRDSLGGRAYSEHDYTQLHRSFLAWMEALHLNPESGAIEDVDAVISSMAEPGPFLAYTHGDPCPDNWLRDSTGLRLIDFEGGGFRHALTDGVYGRIHFPTCWCVNRLPGDIPIEMENEYRTALSEGCPEAREDVRFYNGVVDACAYHVLTGFSADRIATLMREDQSWGISTVRQRALVRFDILSRLTKEFSHREPLGEAYARIAERLRGVWPAEADQMPVYPAFR